MKNDIVEKLKNISRKENYSEQDILYFLVEYCKILEQVNRLHEFKVVRFYRNWSCHSYISKDAEKIFEEIYIIIKAKKYMTLEERDNDEMPAFAELIDRKVTESFEDYSFKKLKEEIERFANDFLNGEIPKWASFYEQLSHVIVDIPLIIKKDNEEIFRFELSKSSGNTKFNGFVLQISYPGGWIKTSVTGELFDSLII